MKQKFKMRNSVLNVLIILFGIVILPMYLLGYGIFQWGYKMTTDEIAQSLQTRANQFIYSLEEELRRIAKLHQECLNDSDLYYYVNAFPIMGRYEQMSCLLTIEKRLRGLKDSSSYISDVTLFLPRLPYIVSAQRGVDPAAKGWSTLLDAPIISNNFTVLDGQLYICAAYPPMSAISNTAPQYVLVIKLSKEKMSEALKSFNVYPEGGAIFTDKDEIYCVYSDEDLDSLPKDEDFLVTGAHSDYLDINMYAYVPKSIVYKGLYMYRNLFAIFTAAVCLLISGYVFFSRWFIGRPIRRLVDSLAQVENGKMDIRIDYTANDEFGYLYTSFNQMVGSLANMIEINYHQKILTQQAELRQLQAQINPHFLHNSFFILYRMAKDEDYENISEFLTYLSEYYRYITRNASMETDLLDEDGHARRYVQIQIARFKKRITADFAELPKHLSKLRVPKLILQPLLENAFGHGLKDTVSGGILRVSYGEEDGKILINVEDNGVGISEKRLNELREKLNSSDQADMERSGIINIHQRLLIKFGAGNGLRVENLAEGGTRFTLIFPNTDKGIKNGKEVIDV